MLNQNLSIIFGTFGTGKTYYAVRNAYRAYLDGAVVISNMWLAFPHVRWYLPSDLPNILHEIYDYHEKVIVPYEAPDSFLLAHDIKRDKDNPPRNFYVLADEGGVFFNARNFQSNFKEKSLLVMLAEPRHFNMQITAITQKLDLIDKTFRDLSQEIIEFSPFLFGIFRRAKSYDLKYLVSEGGWDDEIPTVETSTYFHAYHRRKDTSSFFGGLYFTKEVLGDLALRRDHDITSLHDFFAREDTEVDWREGIASKALSRITELGISQKIINKFAPVILNDPIIQEFIPVIQEKTILDQIHETRSIELLLEKSKKFLGRNLYDFEIDEITKNYYLEKEIPQNLIFPPIISNNGFVVNPQAIRQK